MLFYKIINLAALEKGRAEIGLREDRVSCSAPSRRKSRGEILRIGSHFERRHCIAPELPGRLRFPQPLQKPRFLLRAENRLRRTFFFESSNHAAGVETLHGLLWNQSRKIGARQRRCFGKCAPILRSIAALIGDDQLDISSPA